MTFLHRTRKRVYTAAVPPTASASQGRDALWVISRAKSPGNEFRREYKEMNGWDDFITLTKVVREDDLFVVVSARRTSISYSSDLEALPNFLSKYYGHSNLIVVFPEQFGAAPNLESFSDPIATDIDTQPSEIVLRAKEWWRGMSIRMHEFLTRPRGMN